MKNNIIVDNLSRKVDFIKGKVVLYVSKSYWIASHGYTLYQYDVATKKWQKFAKLNDRKNALLSSFFLTRRLFRAEVRSLYKLNNEQWICIARKGLFKFDANTKTFVKCCSIERGSRPMNLCIDMDGAIYWGDYYFNPNREAMSIHKSDDGGKTWHIAYTFKKGTINHIHGIFKDPYHKGRLIVATGDDDTACIFGYSDDGFMTFITQYSGSQDYRVCQPLFYKDKIVYATDSQYKSNTIRSINRETSEIEDVQPIEGSGIYAVQTEKWSALSTTIEPSEVNLDQNSHLWYSHNGDNWQHLLSFKKDIWKKTYFQFGSIRFPNYEPDATDFLIINGRALKKLDQNSIIISLK